MPLRPPQLIDFALDLSEAAGQVQRRQLGAQEQIWCSVRQRWLTMQPEELVRQALTQYLQQEMMYPRGRMQVERRFAGGGANRSDLVVHDEHLQPWLLVEVKAPHVSHRSGMAQLADYARYVHARYCLSVNGSWASCVMLDREQELWVSLSTLPAYPRL